MSIVFSRIEKEIKVSSWKKKKMVMSVERDPPWLDLWNRPSEKLVPRDEEKPSVSLCHPAQILSPFLFLPLSSRRPALDACCCESIVAASELGTFHRQCDIQKYTGA